MYIVCFPKICYRYAEFLLKRVFKEIPLDVWNCLFDVTLISRRKKED